MRKTARGITVTVTPLKGDTSVTKVAAWVEAGLKEGKGEQVKEEKVAKLGGKPARCFSAILPSAGVRKVRTVRLVTENETKAYMVSVTGPGDKSTDEVLALNQDLLDSWVWKK